MLLVSSTISSISITLQSSIFYRSITMRLSLFLSLWATSAMAVNLYDPNGAAGGSTLSARDTSAVPLSPNHRPLEARQEMDLDLIDSLPDPTVAPTNTAGYNPTAAIAAVVAEISEDPLPQVVRRRSPHERRDVRVVTSTGYTDHVSLGNVAINAPLDCASKDTYMGVKIFTSGPFDTALCAAACSAQSAYNLKHPPSTGDPKTCQFYQTYSSYKNGVYQGSFPLSKSSSLNPMLTEPPHRPILCHVHLSLGRQIRNQQRPNTRHRQVHHPRQLHLHQCHQRRRAQMPDHLQQPLLGQQPFLRHGPIGF